MTKWCFKCGKTKPLDEFYRHPKMSDGRLSKCKECTIADVKENYRGKDITERRRYELERGKRPERRRLAYRYTVEYRRKHPEKAAARRAVQYAIQTGKLKKGLCEMEGPDCHGPIGAHHEDHSKKLDVHWFCDHHHKKAEGQS